MEDKYTGREQTLASNTKRNGELVGRALDDLMRANTVEKVPLGDLARVKKAAQGYLSECAERSMMPTVRGMAARLGLSRNSVYDYVKKHPGSEFSEWLDDFSDLCGEVMMEAALNRTVDTVSAIFIAKSRHGYRDSVVLEVVNNNPLGEARSAEEIAQQYEFLPED